MSGTHGGHGGHRATPRPPGPPASTGEVIRIATSMIVTCVLGAIILGAVYVATDRYAEEARVKNERAAIAQMLDLGPWARVREVRQYLDPVRNEVIYIAEPDSGAVRREIVFRLDGTFERQAEVSSGAEGPKGVRPLSRFFIASDRHVQAGFVIEGVAQGYKNRIRFLLAVKPDGTIAGVRIVEHEEDPGLGAEIATPWFRGQFESRHLNQMSELDVTRDPMPKEWRDALLEKSRIEAWTWAARYRMLQNRETLRPVIYAVTGATISSRAITYGVRDAMIRFERRMERVGRYLDLAPRSQAPVILSAQQPPNAKAGKAP
jgi:H+/Na+-translocating ferredoxin:NAD+ oxidoreductase subunit G